MPVVPDHTGIAPSGDTDTPDGRKQTKTQSWPAGAWEWSRKQGAWRRLTLRRSDGRTYLNRWSVTSDRLGGVMLHRMDAPDPGVDLHDHPWWFVSIILWGGYIEERADIRNACARAETVEPSRGDRVTRKWLSARTMRLDECHPSPDFGARHPGPWSSKGHAGAGGGSTSRAATSTRPDTTPPSGPSDVTCGSTSTWIGDPGDERSAVRKPAQPG